MQHVVAFSGGVDSSLTAALVHRAFPESAAACLGVSASLSKMQFDQAHRAAQEIEIPLWECQTTESQVAKYVENKGERYVTGVMSCATHSFMQLTRVWVELLSLQDDAVRNDAASGRVRTVCTQVLLVLVGLPC